MIPTIKGTAYGLREAADAGATILAPNRELAAALFDWLERQHLGEGHEVWATPRVRDFGGWLRELYLARQLVDAALPRCLSDIEERELWRSVVRESSTGSGLLEQGGAALGARAARRALFEYGIPLAKLASYDSEETLAFVDWNRRFETRCEELRCVSSDGLLDMFMNGATPAGRLLMGAAPIGSSLMWIDSPIWRPAARRWLDKHAAAKVSPPRLATLAKARLVECGSPAIELAAVADWAAGQLRMLPQYRAWICVPDLDLRRAETIDAFDAALAPQRFSLGAGDTPAPYAVAGGTSLAEHSSVLAALAALSATVGTLRFEDFSSLLRSPELQDSLAHASAAVQLDLRLRKYGPTEARLSDWLHLAQTLASAPTVTPRSASSDGQVSSGHHGESPGAAVHAISRLQTFLSILDGARGAQVMSRWVALWIEALEAAPWAHRERWSSSEFQAAERFRELLASLATGDALFGAQKAPAALGILSRAAHQTVFQPQTGIPSIWVSGQLMDPWLPYDGVWITGCGEQRWPPPVQPLAFLPVDLQRNHGVVAAGVQSQLQLAEELQSRWRSRASLCVFSYAPTEVGGLAMQSPIVPAVPAEFSTALSQPHWRDFTRNAPNFESLLDELGPPFDAVNERTHGVATLRAQSRCAFRGFAEQRLETSELDMPVPGFNVRERGELVHQTLEHLWDELQNSATLLGMAAQPLEDLIDRCANRALALQCRRRDPGARWQGRERRRLTALLKPWLETEKRREPFVVEELERSSQAVRLGGLDFKVRIDRVDRLLEGGRILIDYKTGTASTDWRGERPDNPQLPLYALLRSESLVAVAYARVNARENGFIAESSRAGVFKPNHCPSNLEGMPDFSSLILLWSARLEAIANAFADGHAEVAPTDKACKSCRLQPLCRIPSAFDEEDMLDE